MHVSAESSKLVYDTILKFKPRFVALELDEARLATLLDGNRQVGSPFRGGLSFLSLVLLERFAGEITGSPPGSEMLRAIQASRIVGSEIQYIDLPIQQTVAAIRTLPRREKIRLAMDSLTSILLLPFVGLNLSKITVDLESQMGEFRRRYPELSTILIDRREEYMVGRIRELANSTSGLIVAVVGFGHMRSIASLLQKTVGKE